MDDAPEKFFPGLVAGLRSLQADGDTMSTMAVVNMVEKIIRVFDYLGAVLSFAKSDMHAKCESLRAIAPMRPTLQDIITADVEARVVTKKNSCGRNLHRLTGVIRFLRLFLEQLLKSPSITLKDAASKAYTDSLASIHTFMVRNTVWAGMYVLPTRAQFMASIGEDEESSRGMAEEFSRGAAGVEASILALYEQAGVIMPAC